MAEKTRSEYTVLNIVSGVGGYMLNFVVGIISRMVFTRVFTAEYLGVSGLFANVLNMLSLAELGLTNAIVYALYKPLANDDKPQIASLMNFYGKCYRVIALVVMVIGLSIIPFLNLIVKEKPNIEENFYVLYLISLFNTVSGYLFVYRNALLHAAQKGYIVNSVSNIIIVVQNLIQILLMLFVGNYIIYSLVISIFTMLTNVINSEIAKKQYPCIVAKNISPLNSEKKKNLIQNVRALTVRRIGGLLINSTDNIITTYLDGLVTVGLASNYTLFSANLNALLNVVFTSANAGIGNHRVLKGKEESHKLFKALNLANFWLFGWASIGIFIVSTDAVELLFGADYVLPIEIPLIVAINFYMVGMQKAVSSYINVYGIFKPGRYLVIVTAILNLVLSISFGKIWGLFGVLLASAISRLLTNIWHSPYALYKYGFNKSVKRYIEKYIFHLIILLFTGIVCWGVCLFVETNLFLDVLIKFMVCSLIPNFVFVLVFRKTDEFNILLVFLKNVLNKIKQTMAKKEK